MRFDLQAITRKLAAFVLLLSPLAATAQTYNDGPIQLQMRMREVRVNHSDNDPIVGPITNVGGSELRIIPQGRDQANLDGQNWMPLVGVCQVQDNMSVPQISNDFNYTFFNFTYPGASVPQFLDLKIDAWEEDCPADNPPLVGLACGSNNLVFNGGNACCVAGLNCGAWSFPGNLTGCTYYNQDDERCLSDPFVTNINYRLNTLTNTARPPCQWSNHGFLSNPVSCPGNRYEPRIETFWRYTNGTACATPIMLGNVAPGFSVIQHYNSNECYNNLTLAPGNEVWYAITTTGPVGITATLCAAANFDTYMYVLDGCNVATDIIGQNDNFCGNTSQVSVALCGASTYYIVVDGATAAAMGTFTLTIQENPSVLMQVDAGAVPGGVCVGTSATIGGAPTASGGGGGYSYNWSPNFNITSTTVANPTVFPTVTTTYTVTVTDASGCQITDNVTVVVNPGPSINLGPDQTVCPNTSVPLNAGAGYLAYFWSNGSTNPNISATNPGQYFVAVIDIFGCLGRDTMQLANYPTPLLSLGPDTAICQGASLTLDGGGTNSSWAWSNSSATQTITVSTAGTYQVTVTDANSCTRADTIVVGVNALPVITLGPDQTVCPGASAVFDPGPGYPTYAWSNATSNQTASVSTPGTYSVTVTDVNGCQANDAADLFNYPAPAVNITGNLALCTGGSTTLDAGAGFSAYQWSSGELTQTIAPLFPGNYSVTVTDGNGCTASDVVAVTGNPLPVITSLPADTVVCFGSSVTLDAGGGFTNYAWSNSSATQTITVSASGSFAVTVTDGNGCSNSASVDVTVNPQLTVNLGNDTTICDLGSIMLDASPAMQTYLWNDGSNNQYLFVTQPGTYSVTITDPFGCVANDQITITVSSLVQANLLGTDQVLCDGDELLLDAGEGYIHYLWNTGGVDQYLLVDTSGTYSVEVDDSIGCRYADDVTVTLETVPSLALVGEENICPGESVTLDAGPGFTSYLWNTGATTQSITVDQTGTYTVQASTTNCSVNGVAVVGDECLSDMFIPNVFTPNNDNINDQFRLVAVNLEQFHIWIFDRWGKFLFESTDINSMWDGRFNNKDVPEGVYYFRVQYKFIGKEVVEEKNGNVTLLR